MNKVVHISSNLSQGEHVFSISDVPLPVADSMANAIRRELLSRSRGAKVAQLHIEGSRSVFDCISGMDVDYLVFIQRLQSIALDESYHDRIFDFVIDTTAGATVFTSLDFGKICGFTDIYQNKVLARFNKGVKINIGGKILAGIGYVSSRKDDSYYPQFSFSPIDTLIYTVQKKDRVADISFTISSFLTAASLSSLLSSAMQRLYIANMPFVNLSAMNIEQEVADVPVLNHSNKPIEDLSLTVRSLNCLKSMGIENVDQLASYSEEDLLKVPHLGKKSLKEMKSKLQEINIFLSSKYSKK